LGAGSADRSAKLTVTDFWVNIRAKEKFTFLNHVDFIDDFRAAFAPHHGRPFSQKKTHLCMCIY
jgi:hypothetical protein